MRRSFTGKQGSCRYCAEAPRKWITTEEAEQRSAPPSSSNGFYVLKKADEVTVRASAAQPNLSPLTTPSIHRDFYFDLLKKLGAQRIGRHPIGSRSRDVILGPRSSPPSKDPRRTARAYLASSSPNGTRPPHQAPSAAAWTASRPLRDVTVAMSIKPLPGDVAAQIKSSVVITSLNSVVCGLIKNSLDAEATKINVSVDYSRGNCAVEDNGIGILPSEFQEDGGLGQLYYTSKYPHRPDIYGKQGAFLASVAALSLLSVASHHRSYSSHNSMSIHRSRILARHMPALAEHRVLTFPHGTRITVRDLFGSMPVRVKHRALQSERSWASREWDQLVLDAVAVLLAWPHSVSISFRDANGIQALRLRTGGAVKDGGGESRSAYISRTCSILCQASLCDTTEADDWVTIGASAPLLSIAGCVSLTPVATKRVQFVSLGIEPIPNRAGSNVLYEEVNKIFADSSFGSVEAESDSDEFGEQRILEGFTQRELKAKKGVDRWPMFSLVIDLDIHKKDLDVDDLLDDRQQSLSIIVDLLRAMFYQFLKKHHFSPKAVKLLNVSGPQDLSNTTISDVTLSKTVSVGRTTSPGKSRRPRATSERPQSPVVSANSKSSQRAPLQSRAESPFGSWSRVKAGRDSPSYLKNVRSSLPNTVPPSSRSGDDAAAIHSTPVSRITSRISAQPPLVDAAGKLTRKPFMDIDPHALEPASWSTPAEGDTFVWRNPRTEFSLVVDSRTGFVLQSGAASDLEVSKGQTPQPDSKRQGRQEEASERSEWVQNLLSKWKNPAFDLTEPPIPRLPDVSETLGSGIGPAGHQCPASGAVFINAIDEASSTAQSGRLTKENLGKAEVIAQVDNKFVLARVPSKLVRGGAAADSDSSLFLVLIDQHAADERCRVEALMEDYFAIDASDGGDRWTAVTEALEKPLQFELAAREYDLLTRARPHFEKWGIVYDVQIATASVSQPQARRVAKLAVRKLPPAIFERCRLDPKLLVELIRKEMWRINDDPSLRAMVEIDAGSRCGTGEVGGPHPWVSRIYGCPPGILDLINSRACRGAIMFNDPLTMDECAKLLERLRATAFPFQCAHGRPSMVPMLDVGTSMGNSEGKLPQELPDGAFIRQFKQWRSAL